MILGEKWVVVDENQVILGENRVELWWNSGGIRLAAERMNTYTRPSFMVFRWNSGGILVKTR